MAGERRREEENGGIESRKGESCESWVERRWIKEPMNAAGNEETCEFFFFFFCRKRKNAENARNVQKCVCGSELSQFFTFILQP